MGQALPVLITVIGVLASSACSGTGSQAADLVAATSTTPMAVSAAQTRSTGAPSPAAASTPATAGLRPVAFGTGYTWPDGLRVTTSTVKKFTPSETAFGVGIGEQGVRLTVTVTNGTKQTFDTTKTSMTLTFGPDGAEAEPVIDLPNGVGGGTGLPKKIAPGERGTTTFAFSVQPEWIAGLYGRIWVGDAKHPPATFSGAAS